MSTPTQVNLDALTSEIRAAVVNQKANACPMVVRLAWHASGTFDKKDNTGGSDGATMRFEPESTDDANAGLSIVRDMLTPVKARHPEMSLADLWTFAGTKAVEFLGGPKVPFACGRTDASDNKTCPMNGRLPDAAQGAAHLRDVFGRMGFNDQEIVALSGAHTLGRCHMARSGYDGPWTRNPLKFDNGFFKNLMFLEWQPRKWDGPEQFEDVLTGELMMLPTDMALRTDSAFAVWAKKYAEDEEAFFDDFSAAFAKLLALGCPAHCNPANAAPKKLTGKDEASAEFREACMHGSLEAAQRWVAKGADVHSIEATSGRTALHKATFWGHKHIMPLLLTELKMNVDAQDSNGDTPLNDATRFGHVEVVESLLKAGASRDIKNKDGKTALDLCAEYGAPKFGVEKERFNRISALLKGSKL